VWYETTDEKFHLQINPHPLGQTTHYRATVIATRYGLSLDAVGFYDLTLGENDDDLRQCAHCLQPTLSRSNFKSKEWRKRFDSQ